MILFNCFYLLSLFTTFLYGFQSPFHFSMSDVLICDLTLQPLDTVSSRMQTSAFGKSKGLWKTLSEGTWKEAFDGLGISLLLTSNPSIQVLGYASWYEACIYFTMSMLLAFELSNSGSNYPTDIPLEDG